MAAALVILFFGGIFLAILMVISVVGVAMFIAPFAGGALASVMVCETVPGAKGLVDRKSISYTNWWFKIFHLVLPMVDDRCLIDFIEIFVDTIN